jgi:hypothetical protein
MTRSASKIVYRKDGHGIRRCQREGPTVRRRVNFGEQIRARTDLTGPWPLSPQVPARPQRIAYAPTVARTPIAAIHSRALPTAYTMRGAEAAGLLLDDIDWRADQIAVTAREAAPSASHFRPGRAGARRLAGWLTGGRPQCAPRAVFVTMRRPDRQLTPKAVPAVMAVRFEVSDQWKPHRGHVRKIASGSEVTNF